MILVVAAGGLGAGLRFAVSHWLTRRGETELPWGTAVVNVVGAMALGLIVGMGASRTPPRFWIGLLSGFTTYSTWMVESVGLWAEHGGGRRRSLVNLIGVYVAGLGAATIGWLTGGVLA